MDLLDTNVLVYAVDKGSALFQKAREIIENSTKGELATCVSMQNLSEFYAVVTDSSHVARPLTPEEAKEEVEWYLECPDIEKLVIDSSVMSLAVELAERYSIRKQNFFDTLLVATMIKNEVGRIITRDVNHFSLFEEIEVNNPFQSDK